MKKRLGVCNETRSEIAVKLAIKGLLQAFTKKKNWITFNLHFLPIKWNFFKKWTWRGPGIENYQCQTWLSLKLLYHFLRQLWQKWISTVDNLTFLIILFFRKKVQKILSHFFICPCVLRVKVFGLLRHRKTYSFHQNGKKLGFCVC